MIFERISQPVRRVGDIVKRPAFEVGEIVQRSLVSKCSQLTILIYPLLSHDLVLSFLLVCDQQRPRTQSKSNNGENAVCFCCFFVCNIVGDLLTIAPIIILLLPLAAVARKTAVAPTTDGKSGHVADQVQVQVQVTTATPATDSAIGSVVAAQVTGQTTTAIPTVATCEASIMTTNKASSKVNTHYSRKLEFIPHCTNLCPFLSRCPRSEVARQAAMQETTPF